MKIESLEQTKKGAPGQPSTFVGKGCAICKKMGHTTNDCPTIPAFRVILNEQNLQEQANLTAAYKKPYNPQLSEAKSGVEESIQFGVEI